MNVAVVGLGKLGLPMAALFAAGGHNVVGIDVSTDVVKAVNRKIDPYQETGLAKLLGSIRTLRATTDMSAVADADVIFIVVPTPSDFAGRFQERYVLEVIAGLGPHIGDRWRTVVVSSTVMPGTMVSSIAPALEDATGLEVGDTIGLAYSPEFIALGSVLHDMANPDFVLIGGDYRSSGDVSDVLSAVIESASFVEWTGFVDAEIAKIAINAFVTMKISYANALAEICESIAGADARVVAQCVGRDTRVGRSYLIPGGPFGGPCFPRDSLAFATFSPSPALANATQEINEHQILRLCKLLAPYRSVAILGLAYKPGTTVIEQSLGSLVGRHLQRYSVVDVVWHDPLARECPALGKRMNAQAAVDRSEAVLVALVAKEYASLDYGNRFVIDVWRQLDERANTFVVGLGGGVK